MIGVEEKILSKVITLSGTLRRSIYPNNQVKRAKGGMDRTRGRFCTVDFIKRGNGERRIMNCRTGVRVHSNGGSLGYDPAKKNLVTVWEKKSFKKDDDGKVIDAGYRQIPLDGIISISYGGEVYYP